jgi:hypothetical protein
MPVTSVTAALPPLAHTVTLFAMVARGRCLCSGTRSARRHAWPHVVETPMRILIRSNE